MVLLINSVGAGCKGQVWWTFILRVSCQRAYSSYGWLAVVLPSLWLCPALGSGPPRNMLASLPPQVQVCSKPLALHCSASFRRSSCGAGRDGHGERAAFSLATVTKLYLPWIVWSSLQGCPEGLIVHVLSGPNKATKAAVMPKAIAKWV